MKTIAIFVMCLKPVCGKQLENKTVQRNALLRMESPSTLSASFVGEKAIMRDPFDQACKSFNLSEPPYYFHDKTIKPRDFETAAFEDHEFDAVPIRGDYSGVQRFLRKLADGGTGRIVLIGNSFTLGHLCNVDAPPESGFSHLAGNEDDVACAWEGRLVRWLQKTFPQAKVMTENLAIGASNACLHLSRGLSLISKLEADLILLDVLQNDVLDFLSFGIESAECFENYVRLLHSTAPRAGIAVLLAGGKLASESSYYNLERAIADYYNLPTIDYTVLVRKDRERFWPDSGNHPPSRTHQLVADLFSHAWGSLFRAMCNFPVEARKLEDRMAEFPKQPMLKGSTGTQTCVTPLRHYSSYMKNDVLPEVLAGDWRLYSDVPGKPGWIANEPGARIRFKVSFESVPKLKVTYLKSYQGVGVAQLLLTGRDFALSRNLSAIWEKHESEPFTEWSMALPNTTMDLEFVVVTGKFKIQEVMSC